MDLLGKALWDYYNKQSTDVLLSHSSLDTREEVPASYFFRPFNEMPDLEQEALRLCQGSVLDIGCGAGSHCLYLQNAGLPCTGLDSSPKAIETARQRGVKNARCSDILEFHSGKYDTLLLMMNGIGIAGALKGLPEFLRHLKGLLRPQGQILMDSSDLIYMFEADEDGGVWVPGEVEYYGEVTYRWEYGGQFGPAFPWLFIDFHTLKEHAAPVGFHAELIRTGPHFDYLARLTQITG
jgi:SAM-dependent methyltransferase